MMLDTPRMLAYIAALALSGPAVAKAGGEFKVRGLTLPGGAVRIADDRYRLSSGWDGALKFFKQSLKPEKYPRRFIVNQPGVKAIHVANTEPGGEWEGFNLYEQQGEVRLYVLAREKR